MPSSRSGLSLLFVLLLLLVLLCLLFLLLLLVLLLLLLLSLALLSCLLVRLGTFRIGRGIGPPRLDTRRSTGRLGEFGLLRVDLVGTRFRCLFASESQSVPLGSEDRGISKMLMDVGGPCRDRSGTGAGTETIWPVEAEAGRAGLGAPWRAGRAGPARNVPPSTKSAVDCYYLSLLLLLLLQLLQQLMMIIMIIMMITLILLTLCIPNTIVTAPRQDRGQSSRIGDLRVSHRLN